MKVGNLIDRKYVVALWLGFFLVKFILGYLHLRASRKKFSLLKVDEQAHARGEMAVKNSGRLVDEINAFVDSFNAASRRQHLIASLGYFVAAITTLLTLYGDLKDVKVPTAS